MKQIAIDEIKNGDIMAEDLIYIDGDVLIKKNTALKETYVNLLRQLDITHIFIEDKEAALNDYMQKVDILKAQLEHLLEQAIYQESNKLKRVQSIANSIWIDFKKEKFAHELLLQKPDLYYHAVTVTIMCLKLAQSYNMKKPETIDLLSAALLHNIGLRYVTVPYKNQEIEKLLPNEIFSFKKHTILAYSALESERWISPEMKTMIVSHHEHLDGTGYPLKQKNQSTGCKILQASSYLASATMGFEMQAREISVATEQLWQKAGTWFDAEVTAKLLSIVNGN